MKRIRPNFRVFVYRVVSQCNQGFSSCALQNRLPFPRNSDSPGGEPDAEADVADGDKPIEPWFFAVSALGDPAQSSSPSPERARIFCRTSARVP